MDELPKFLERELDDSIYFENALVVAPAKPGARHHFGGAPRMAAPNPFAGKPPLHVLLDLDTSDPILAAFPFYITGRLQLLYPFRYEGTDLTYRRNSAGEAYLPALIATEEGERSSLAYQRKKLSTPDPNWPYAGYPKQLPLIPVEFRLPAAQVIIEGGPNMPALLVGAPYDQPAPGRLHTRSIDNIGLGFDVVCEDLSCPSRANGQTMQLISIVPNRPFRGLTLWSKDGNEGDYVWIYHCICATCGLIYTANVTD